MMFALLFFSCYATLEVHFLFLLGSIAECSLMPKRAKNHNLFSPTLTMEKSDKYDADAKAQFDKFIEKYNKPYKYIC